MEVLHFAQNDTKFWKEAHLMTQQQVHDKIHTKEVLKAFDLAKHDHLPPPVKRTYADIADQFAIYSDYTAKYLDEESQKRAEKLAPQMAQKMAGEMATQMAEGIAAQMAGEMSAQKELEKTLSMCMRMIEKNMEDSLILEISGISKQELMLLKEKLKG
jgi:hypothetical protein